MGPDVVVEHLERERDVERDGLCAVAVASADVDVTVLDAEEERGAKGDGGKVGGGELAHEGYDGGALVERDGVVEGNVAVDGLGEQGCRVVTGPGA